jgi:hypothetical protein
MVGLATLTYRIVFLSTPTLSRNHSFGSESTTSLGVHGLLAAVESGHA